MNNAKIKSVEFVFENCERVSYKYNEFKFFNINNNEVHFRLENTNIHRLNQYQDICTIKITHQDNEKENIEVNWEDTYSDNLYQFVNHKNLNQGTIEITISKKQYLHREIKETEQEIIKLNNKLKKLKKQLKHE